MMHLSLLSEGFVSDSFNDAGPMVSTGRPSAPSPLHFAALCRGLVVLFALALPIGITLLARTGPAEADQPGEARSIASHAVPVRATNG